MNYTYHSAIPYNILICSSSAKFTDILTILYNTYKQ